MFARYATLLHYWVFHWNSNKVAGRGAAAGSPNALARRATRFVVLAGLLMLGAGGPAQQAADIVLRPVTPLLKPTEFYVAKVVDERQVPHAVAYLIPVPARLGQPLGPAKPVDLHGGGLGAFQQFVRGSVTRNANLRPLTIRLQELQVREGAVTNAPGYVDGRVVIKLAFEWQRDGRTIRLTDYQGGARYRRLATQLNVVEPTLRQALADGLTYLNGWINQQVPFNKALATRVQVRFFDYGRNGEADTLFYTPARPLAWTDFTGQPRPGHYAAAVFPSFAYQGFTRVADGTVYTDLTMKAFVVRSSSWVSDSGRTESVLNHEQRHFDLVRIVVERFKRKVLTGNLQVDFYLGNIQFQYLESFKEMNRLQEQYDAEVYGNPSAQARWDHLIDGELRACGVKD